MRMAKPQLEVVKDILQLKNSLSSELQKGDGFDSARTLDILQQLDKQPIDLFVLSKTLVGTIVSKFKNDDNNDVSSTSKSLVRKWKKLAKAGGVPSSSSAINASKEEGGKSLTAQRIKHPPSVASSSPGPKFQAPAVPINPEWSKYPTLRQNICKKLMEVFLLDTKNPVVEVSNLVTKIELEMDSKFQPMMRDRQGYTSKARQLNFNLKKNVALRGNLTDGNVTVQELIKMTPQQLATSEKREEQESIAKAMEESRRLDWDTANESKINEMCGIKGDLLNASLFTCGRCKSPKTTSTQKQTRSADEPMTVFVLCTNCGLRWKC
mmetsp:Transcript_32529/g.37674  ORF Transcript_32529/g.37674 Transcript_32529/m.37674 type:complete len:323 (-) Transcript_32529:237-1205(-)